MNDPCRGGTVNVKGRVRQIPVTRPRATGQSLSTASRSCHRERG